MVATRIARALPPDLDTLPMNRPWLKILAAVVLLLVIGAGTLLLWASRLPLQERDVVRPTYARFELGAGAADGSRRPAPNGLAIDSAGDARILPPMPPEKPFDVHTAANQRANFTIRSCFWPGPRARSGVFSNDANTVWLENQFPDTGATYTPTVLRLPAGATLVMRGQFPHARHWNFNTYDRTGIPHDALSDVDVDPDPDSSNPFRDAVRRDVEPRHYTIRLVNGTPPEPRPRNTLYTMTDPGEDAYLWMRTYVPDGSRDWLGSVPLPEIELHTADGKFVTGEAACAATLSPMRGKQLARLVDPRLALVLIRMPWIDARHPGIVARDVVPFKTYFNRVQVLADAFVPSLSPREPKHIGAWWSNRATRYGYVNLSLQVGKVWAVTGRMPKTPRTWHGEAVNDPSVEMRYMSLCAVSSAIAATTNDCAYDEQLQASVDASGHFLAVVSRQEERPSNARAECGVVWIDFGNGDGVVGGLPDLGYLVNRHTTVNPAFARSWFAVARPGTEREVMGETLPYAVNLKDKAAFEALGCPVDRTAIRAKLPAAG